MSTTGAPRLQGRVLIADDGADNRRLLSLLVRKTGLEVSLAENGAVACEMVEQSEKVGEPFDLILMDMQMPELDGFGATARLRHSGFTRPIIAITAFASDKTRELCLRSGCDGFAAKPIEPSVLYDLLSHYLHKDEA